MKPQGPPIPVADPYNMYFTPDGRYAIVVAERLHRLDFRDAHTFSLHKALTVPCAGVDHMDFTANGRYALVSCEFSNELLKLDVQNERIVKTIALRPGAVPQDVKLSPDGKVFYVADSSANGLWEIDGGANRLLGFLPTGRGAHGLYPSRDARYLYVTDRGEGAISVISFRTRKQVAKWRIPGGGSPDMGGVSADGKVFWISGRYNGVRLRDLDDRREAACEDPGRQRPARRLRLASARPLLARPHGHPPLRGGLGERRLALAEPGEAQQLSTKMKSNVVFWPPKSTVQMLPSPLANWMSAWGPSKNDWKVAIGEQLQVPGGNVIV